MFKNDIPEEYEELREGACAVISVTLKKRLSKMTKKAVKANTENNNTSTIELEKENDDTEQLIEDIRIIEQEKSESKPKVVLYQNEPNPFSAKTTIRFDMPEEGAATMTIYDVTGKVLSTINNHYPKAVAK